MTKVRTWAGLDVHAAATVACVVDARSGELSVRRLPGRTSEVAAFCAQLRNSSQTASQSLVFAFLLSNLASFLA